MKTTIAVLGVGLIGGSIAKALRANSDYRMIGYDVRDDYVDKALTNGVISAGTTNLKHAVQDADVIIVATPVEQINELLKRLSDITLKQGAIVTDVGSTKLQIMECASKLTDKGVCFIGGHPMAGSHKSGVDAVNERLFENAYYVLTPGPNSTDVQVEKLKEILSYTNAKIVIMDADEHDRVVGAVSHFPHILAAVLVNQVAGYNKESDWHQRLAAGGFRDITRIASSNPRMWRDVLMSNRDFLLQIAEDWQQGLNEIMALVADGNRDQIEEFFASARDFRERLPERRKGALPSLNDLYIDIPDHPGEIGRITTLLGAKDISINNISILEAREDIFGVLRITFRSESELEKGEELLRFFEYNVYRLD
ncbi:prephenate dehydrogenase [Brevibacillus ginsengisoli]|uniref:prephenate dehydrogenase n=1 Tax=Brevibacillus ginsengisoli TaxID=363854 RepID=UPI003CEE9C92